MSGIDDVLDTDLLSEFYCDGVDTLCKGGLQRHRVAGEVAIGVGRCPGDFLLLASIVDLHGEIAVPTTVAGRETLIHGFGIDKELER